MFFIYIWNYFMSDLCELANTFQLYCNHAPVTNVVVFNRKNNKYRCLIKVISCLTG